MQEPVRSIVIAGGGVAGWLTAALLARALDTRRIAVRVIDTCSATDGIDPLDRLSGSTLPPLPVLHAELGLDEAALLRATRGTFKLGSEFRDWDAHGGAYLLPFGEIGARIEAVGFHHYLRRLAGLGHALHVDEFSLPAQAARQARFAHPSDDPRAVQSTYEYGYHLDVTAYAQLLREYSVGRGVTLIAAGVAGVRLRTGDGFIETVELDNGESLSADLFIDCSGARAALIGALGTPFLDFSHWLPCDGALLGSATAAAQLPPMTTATALASGWCQRVPLQQRTAIAVLTASGFASDDFARAELAGATPDSRDPDPVALRFTNGRRARFSEKNCVAIGAAAGFLEPIGSTAIHFIAIGVQRLLGMFPTRDHAPGLAAEYNRVMTGEFDNARDFAILHYHATRRDDAPLWNHVRTMALPESLDYKLSLFRHRGRIVLYDDETFDEGDWACTFVGQGERAERYTALADQVDTQQLLGQIGRIRAVMKSAAEAMPPHRAYLERYCAGGK